MAVALLLVAVGAIYGYARYRLGQIKALDCPTCASVASGAPFNVLLVGADTRQGVSGALSASQLEGSADTVKILHIDPGSGGASMLSMSYDTYVQLSDMPSGTGIAPDNKITTAFDGGTTPLVQTIQNTFGIPISHFVVTDFSGITNLVNSVGGIKLDFRYPVRDSNNGQNMSGLLIPKNGCQTLNGTMALALARSRYYQYEERPGYWVSDPSADIGRIQRGDLVVESVINKAKSSYNPITLNSFVGAAVHNITVDKGMSTSTMISLFQRYHAFSGSSLKTYTLPTYAAYNRTSGDVEVVQEPQAQQVIAQFLGTQPNSVATPPVDAYNSPITIPSTSAAAPSGGGGASPGNTGGAASGAPPPPAPTPTPPYDPTPC